MNYAFSGNELLTLVFVDEILWCDRSNETSPAVLSHNYGSSTFFHHFTKFNFFFQEIFTEIWLLHFEAVLSLRLVPFTPGLAKIPSYFVFLASYFFEIFLRFFVKRWLNQAPTSNLKRFESRVTRIRAFGSRDELIVRLQLGLQGAQLCFTIKRWTFLMSCYFHSTVDGVRPTPPHLQL